MRNDNSALWDRVAPCFCQAGAADKNYFPGRDNLDAVWPTIIQITRSLPGWPDIEECRICDFGCGTGNLAERLSGMSRRVFACDTSCEMIARARSTTFGSVNYGVGSIEFLRANAPFQLITSVMVFQFIADLIPTIRALQDSLDPSGILLFATHNSQYVRECIKRGEKFRGIDGRTFPSQGEILIYDSWIETYVRTPEWYDELLTAMGFVRLGSLFCRVPAAELPGSTCAEQHSPKYHIAWYQKRF